MTDQAPVSIFVDYCHRELSIRLEITRFSNLKIKASKEKRVRNRSIGITGTKIIKYCNAENATPEVK